MTGKEEFLCKLNRSLYGLKQAARVWNSTVKEILIGLGFQQSEADACLFTKRLSNGVWIYLLIYVDHMIIVCKDGQQIVQLEEELQRCFEIYSLGEVSQFLSIKVTKDKHGVYSLSQQCFIQEIAGRFGLNGAKMSKYPVDPGYFRQQEGNALADNVQYHSLVGALLYITTNSRPDIAAAVSILIRRTSQPAQRDWVELKRAVLYLLVTQNC